MMEIFGLSYLVLGLIAVAGCVLDADGVIGNIRNLPKRATDYICASMYKYIYTHRPALIQKFELASPPIDDITGDNLYEMNFIINEIDVEYFRRISHENLIRKLSSPYCHIPCNYTDYAELEKFIRERVRTELYKRILDFVSIRAWNLPSGDVKVNVQLLCRKPIEPRLAWAVKHEMLLTINRFKL